MAHLNVEIKARCAAPSRVRQVLEEKEAEYIGRDRQRDTYFRVPEGRLKLRDGEIENALIYYRREDQKGPKRSDVILYHPEPGSTLGTLLTAAIGVDVVVEKVRDIYFIENVKFHVDDVASLGSFVEIEAIDRDGSIGADELRRQCEAYLELLDVEEEDLVSESYSDLLRSLEQ